MGVVNLDLALEQVFFNAFFGQAVFRTAGLCGSLGEGTVRILEVFDSMRILVSGAVGKMGQEVCKQLQGAEGFELVGGVDISGKTLPV